MLRLYWLGNRCHPFMEFSFQIWYLYGFCNASVQFNIRLYWMEKIFINSKRWILFSFSGWLAAIVITSVAFLPTILHLELNNFFKMINKIAFILCGPVLGIIPGKGVTSILKNDTSLENQL